MKYFGMTTSDRVNAGQYVEAYINVGNTNEVWGPDIDADDERFVVLRNAAYAELDRVKCNDRDGNL